MEPLPLMETVSYLSKASIFSSLSEEDLRRLSDLLIPKEFPKGEIVIHQGDFGDALYLIYRGEVDVILRNQERAESVVGKLKEGDFFGEMALLTGSPRSASVRARSDCIFLVLFKEDFDTFLQDHPHLALLFSRILAERINTTNLRYAREVGREEQLRKLLRQEEEEHLTRLIGKTKQFQTIEKKIEEYAQSDQTLLVVGPEGAATEDVARLIHLKGARRDGPLIVVDVGGGNEWKTYYGRIQPSMKGGDESTHLFEEFQISTLFGHEQGSIAGAEASRLGAFELADGGAVVLKNIDRLSPGARERLLFYLFEKRFYRLGGRDGVPADVRVIATLSTSLPTEEMKGFFHGKVPVLFWENRIDLPPLVLRRRDIPIMAEAFLEKGVRLTGKTIKTISPAAMNILVRYSWPGNDRELESVIDRGVLVCEGDILLPEHIFLGLTPYADKGRVNLLRVEAIKRTFSNLGLRAKVQALTVFITLGAIGLTLFGSRDASTNLGMGIIWYFWWPYLLLSFIFLGRIYCSICPIDGVTRLVRKIGSLNRPEPRIFNRIGVGAAALLTLGLLWSEYFFHVKEIPARTPIVLGAIIGSAVVANLIFRREVWCHFLCPMGFFSGICSCLATVELRANNTVCSSQCRSTFCYKGDDKQAGCPMRLFPVSLTSNQMCKMCGTCAHNCPYNSVHLDLRWPGSEIWENREPDLVTSLSVPALLAILFPLFLLESARIGGNGQLPLTPLFWLSAVGGIALFAGACFTDGKSRFRERASAYGYAYLPLAFAGHLAFLFPSFIKGCDWVMTLFSSGANLLAATSLWPQRLFIALGMLWSEWAIWKLSSRQGLKPSVVHATLIIVLGVALILIVRR
jgi:DNA-binding NtrC family response regulator